MHFCTSVSFYAPRGCRNPQKPEEVVRSLEARIIDSCELPCGLLGNEPRFSARAVSALNLGAFFPAAAETFSVQN